MEVQQGEARRGEAPGLEPSPIIVAEGLSLSTLRIKSYANVSLSVARGEAHALCGEDGSGKTELLLTLAGRVRPTAGRLVVLGHDGTSLAGMAHIRAHAAMGIFEGINDVQLALRVRTIASAELGLAGKRSNKAATLAFLDQLGLADAAEKTVGSLDAQTYHRLGVALALAHDPDVLVVQDIESHMTEHQSQHAAKALVAAARERGIAVVVGCTDYDVARCFDTVTCLTEGARAQQAAVARHTGEVA